MINVSSISSKNEYYANNNKQIQKEMRNNLLYMNKVV